MAVPVYPRSSTYRLNQRKRLTVNPSAHDHTHGSRAVFSSDPQQQMFAMAKASAARLSQYKSRDRLKLRKFSWEEDDQ
jgi:hypothetical protein